MIGFKEGKCVLCGVTDVLNEGICGKHSDETAQAYLFGFADGKASAIAAPAPVQGDAAVWKAGALAGAKAAVAKVHQGFVLVDEGMGYRRTEYRGEAGDLDPVAIVAALAPPAEDGEKEA